VETTLEGRQPALSINAPDPGDGGYWAAMDSPIPPRNLPENLCLLSNYLIQLKNFGAGEGNLTLVLSRVRIAPRGATLP